VDRRKTGGQRQCQNGPVRLPPRLLPILYRGLAHVALLLAFAAIAIDARAATGFF